MRSDEDIQNKHTRSPSFQNQLPFVSIGDKGLVASAALMGSDMLERRIGVRGKARESSEERMIFDFRHEWKKVHVEQFILIEDRIPHMTPAWILLQATSAKDEVCVDRSMPTGRVSFAPATSSCMLTWQIWSHETPYNLTLREK
jgi:hypothetical protein